MPFIVNDISGICVHGFPVLEESHDSVSLHLQPEGTWTVAHAATHVGQSTGVHPPFDGEPGGRFCKGRRCNHFIVAGIKFQACLAIGTADGDGTRTVDGAVTYLVGSFQTDIVKTRLFDSKRGVLTIDDIGVDIVGNRPQPVVRIVLGGIFQNDILADKSNIVMDVECRRGSHFADGNLLLNRLAAGGVGSRKTDRVSSVSRVGGSSIDSPYILSLCSLKRPLIGVGIEVGGCIEEGKVFTCLQNSCRHGEVRFRLSCFSNGNGLSRGGCSTAKVDRIKRYGLLASLLKDNNRTVDRTHTRISTCNLPSPLGSAWVAGIHERDRLSHNRFVRAQREVSLWLRHVHKRMHVCLTESYRFKGRMSGTNGSIVLHLSIY